MIVAGRYASSLMQLAQEKNKMEDVRQDMRLIGQVYSENRDFMLFVNSPLIKTDKKIVVLESIFKGKISDLTMSFLVLMANKHRESYLKDIATAFEESYKEKKNIFTAVVTSAVGLDKTTKEKVLDLVKKQLNGEVELIEKVDPSTIGGFILKVGDKQVDRTVARQLSNLKKDFINKN
jgi:F-type H+-transporting ATPase subunit delta